MHPNLFRLPEWIPLLGGDVITSFGVMMLLAFLTAAILHRWEMRRVGLDPDYTWDFLFGAVVGGIVGAKLYYLLLNFPVLLEDPLFMLLSRGGLVWYGGFLGAAGIIVWQIRKRDLPLGTVADITAAPLAIAYGIGRIGCFLVGDDYGRPTDSWVGVKFPDGSPPTRPGALREYFGVEVSPDLIEKYGQVIPVHPTQLYEVGLSLLIFAVLWRIRDHRHRAGWLFMLWLVLAGAERFVVEFVRVKDDRFFAFLTLAQLISLAIIAAGTVGMRRLSRPEPTGSSASPGAGGGGGGPPVGS